MRKNSRILTNFLKFVKCAFSNYDVHSTHISLILKGSTIHFAHFGSRNA